jgi:hypothetical protein
LQLVQGNKKCHLQLFWYILETKIVTNDTFNRFGQITKWGGLVYIKYNSLPNNIIMLVNIDKFEPNPILANINKLKTYKYLNQVPKGLEAIIKGGGEHKDDLQ